MTNAEKTHDGELELAPRDPTPAPAPMRAIGTTPTPADLLSMAVTQGADLDRLERLMGLQAQWEAKEARKAFIAAMTGFKAKPITIFKRARVRYDNRDGSVTAYNHASLADVVDAAIAGMAQFGLSHRWDTRQLDGGQIEVTCVITHEQGHSENTTLRSGADTSGGKNSIQAVASTVSYLQRYTLLSATGLATREMDDDAQSAEPSLVDDVSEGSRAEPTERDKAIADLYACADEGTGALLSAWRNMPEKTRTLVGIEFGKIKARAAQVGA